MKSIIMIKTEEHKLDILEKELTNIENIAKNLDLNSKDEYRMILTEIVQPEKENSKSLNKDLLIQELIRVKLNFEKQLKEIDDIIKKIS